MLSNRLLQKNVRRLSNLSKNNEISPVFTNRNPRNLEKLRIAYKPNGWHLERPGRCFWHNLILTPSTRYVSAAIVHFENGEVIKASTQEWPIRKRLYKTNDVAAYINLGRVLAQRCLESGLTEVACSLEATNESGKVACFLRAVEEGGVVLSEPSQFMPHRPWDQLRPEKPWEVTE